MKVPFPPFDARYVYHPSNEDARFFLTGLPKPTYRFDGHDVCAACNGKVRVKVVTTHVRGSTPVRMIEDHICRQKVA